MSGIRKKNHKISTRVKLLTIVKDLLQWYQ